MSWPGWVSEADCWPWGGTADGGGPGGEGGRRSEDGGTWFVTSGGCFVTAPSGFGKEQKER